MVHLIYLPCGMPQNPRGRSPAPVMELVDMRDLGSRAAMRVGSSPFRRTTKRTRPRSCPFLWTLQPEGLSQGQCTGDAGARRGGGLRGWARRQLRYFPRAAIDSVPGNDIIRAKLIESEQPVPAVSSGKGGLKGKQVQGLCDLVTVCRECVSISPLV